MRLKIQKEMVYGALMATFILLPAFFFGGTFSPKPYTDVTLLSHSPSDDDLTYNLAVNFYKNDACDFGNLVTFGYELGRWSTLSWSNNEDDSGDRMAGGQTLSISIDTHGRHFDYLEVRTRHICGGSKVDRVFIKIKPKISNT